MESKPWKVLSKEEERYWIFLFYGASGVGKTYLSAQFPDPLILACDPGKEGGALSALKFSPKVIRVNSYKQMVNLLPELRKLAGQEFKTLVVDSLSYLQRWVMDDILTVVGKEVPRFDDWNLNAQRVRSLVMGIGEIENCHIIFTATESITKDEVVGRIYGGPNLPGKLAIELPQACDVVGRLYARAGYDSNMKKTVVYRISFTPDEVWIGKDRSGLLPKDVETDIHVFDPLLHSKEERR